MVYVCCIYQLFEFAIVLVEMTTYVTLLFTHFERVWLRLKYRLIIIFFSLDHSLLSYLIHPTIIFLHMLLLHFLYSTTHYYHIFFTQLHIITSSSFNHLIIIIFSSNSINISLLLFIFHTLHLSLIFVTRVFHIFFLSCFLFCLHYLCYV